MIDDGRVILLGAMLGVFGAKIAKDRLTGSGNRARSPKRTIKEDYDNPRWNKPATPSQLVFLRGALGPHAAPSNLTMRQAHDMITDAKEAGAKTHGINREAWNRMRRAVPKSARRK